MKEELEKREEVKSVTYRSTSHTKDFMKDSIANDIISKVDLSTSFEIVTNDKQKNY